MLGRRSREFPSHHTEPALAAKATDLDALRTAVVDAAAVGYGLWFSYLFVLFYFAIAAGAITHRDLLLESPVKLPFLNVELPLKAFFILGPLVFLVVHTYVLLHFLLLASKVGAFHVELKKTDPRRRRKKSAAAPSIAEQHLCAVSRRAARGSGRCRWLSTKVNRFALISLVAGPIALLVLFQLQFLPYHSPWMTWWQRVAIVLDLILLWLLWPPIARGDTALLTWNDLGRVRVAVWLALSLLPLMLVFIIATFPGEWLEETLPPVRLIPTSLRAWQKPSVEAIQKAGSGWATLHELLVAGRVDPITRQPVSLWSNRLVLLDFAIGDRLKFGSENKLSISSETVSLRARRLEGSVLVEAHLPNADFTGANLSGAFLSGANLEGATLNDANLNDANLENANLRGAPPGVRHPQRRRPGGRQPQGRPGGRQPGERRPERRHPGLLFCKFFHHWRAAFFRRLSILASVLSRTCPTLRSKAIVALNLDVHSMPLGSEQSSVNRYSQRSNTSRAAAAFTGLFMA
jgi:hypothetical protein